MKHDIAQLKSLVDKHGIDSAAHLLNTSKRTLYRRLQPLSKGRWGDGPSVTERVAVEYRAVSGHIDVGPLCIAIWGEDTRRTRNRLFDTIYQLKLRGVL